MSFTAFLWVLLAGAGLLGQLVIGVLTAYLLLLGVASLGRLRPPQARRAEPDGPRWAILVPAHDEVGTLPRLLESLAALDYPTGAWHVYVIADNCTDATAAVARIAGRRLGLPLTVWERHDAIARGKGHALHWALAKLAGAPAPAADGWVVFDADTRVDSGCLHAFAASWLEGHQAIQARYGILDADSSPRRRLAYLSAGLYHQARAHGREWLGLSAGLFGNGMAFDWSIAEQFGWPAFSIVEDIEFQAILALHGHRVHYQPKAEIWAEAPRTLKASGTQRQRWEHGRTALVRFYVKRLVAEGLRTRACLPFGVALDLLMPSYTRLWALTLASAALIWLPLGSGWLWLGSVFNLTVYLIAGLQQVKGPRWLGPTLLWAPVFALWVLAVTRRSGQTQTWVRTPRE